MRFEWDERKNRTNLRKHGIGFEVACGVFEDSNCLVEANYDDPETGESRWQVIGSVPQHPAILMVIYVNRTNEWKTFQTGEEPEEVFRIVSARAADSSEVRRYQGL